MASFELLWCYIQFRGFAVLCLYSGQPFRKSKAFVYTQFSTNMFDKSRQYRLALLPVPYLSLAQFRAQLPNLIANLLAEIHLHGTCLKAKKFTFLHLYLFTWILLQLGSL